MAIRALERLAKAYWKPLYIFVRQRGVSHEDGADAVQGFFAYLLSQDLLRSVGQRETRFRTFLLHCFQQWLISEQRKKIAQKRGGEFSPVPLSDLESVSDLISPKGGNEPPELAFDRRWAQTIFHRAQERLDYEVSRRDRPEYLRELQQRVFYPGANGPNWAEVAEQFNLSEGAVRKAAFDLRTQFTSLLRAEVSALVSDDSEVNEELRYLFQLLTNH